MRFVTQAVSPSQIVFLDQISDQAEVTAKAVSDIHDADHKNSTLMAACKAQMASTG